MRKNHKIGLGRYTVSAGLFAALCALPCSANAEAGKQAKPVTCTDYSIAKLNTGEKIAEIGVCTSAKGKPTYLRTFRLVTLTDADGKQVSVMVGYR